MHCPTTAAAGCARAGADARAIDVGVQQADLEPARASAAGQQRGHGTLAHAPLARADGNHALDRSDFRGRSFPAGRLCGAMSNLNGRLGGLCAPRQPAVLYAHRPKSEPTTWSARELRKPAHRRFQRARGFGGVGRRFARFPGCGDIGRCGPGLGFRDRHDCPCGGSEKFSRLKGTRFAGKSNGKRKKGTADKRSERGRERGLTRRRGGHRERGVGQRWTKGTGPFRLALIW